MGFSSQVSTVLVCKLFPHTVAKHSCVSDVAEAGALRSLGLCPVISPEQGSLCQLLLVPCVLPFLLQLFSGGKLKDLILSVLKAYRRYYSSGVPL